MFKVFIKLSTLSYVYGIDNSSVALGILECFCYVTALGCAEKNSKSMAD